MGIGQDLESLERHSLWLTTSTDCIGISRKFLSTKILLGSLSDANRRPTVSVLLSVRRRRWLPAMLWTVFAMGLLAQFFSPHLKIEHNAFVMPPELLVPGKPISPSDIVAKERVVQSVSAVLTLCGALGLGRCYWQRLFGRSSP